MMPSFFVGHGSPMNALSKNAWTDSLNKIGRSIRKPMAILAISAHWETAETEILAVEKPRTIHDFYGFPQELFEIQYPAVGAIELADKIASTMNIKKNTSWGLDHGTWSILVHLYPQADVPVLQLSISRNLDLKGHLALGEKLKLLRENGVMILGSGNIVHNLRMLNWKNEAAKPFEWASEFDRKIKEALIKKDTDVLCYQNGITNDEWKLSVPTLEHYIPLLYVVGASRAEESAIFPFEGFSMGSLSMRSVMF